MHQAQHGLTEGTRLSKKNLEENYLYAERETGTSRGRED